MTTTSDSKVINVSDFLNRLDKFVTDNHREDNLTIEAVENIAYELSDSEDRYKTGVSEWRYDHGIAKYVCSRCGFKTFDVTDMFYCPHCGYTMANGTPSISNDVRVTDDWLLNGYISQATTDVDVNLNYITELMDRVTAIEEDIAFNRMEIAQMRDTR